MRIDIRLPCESADALLGEQAWSTPWCILQSRMYISSLREGCLWRSREEKESEKQRDWEQGRRRVGGRGGCSVACAS